MEHQIVISSEKGESRSYPVAGGRLSIGRHPKNAIVIEDELVSIYHAEVFVKNGKTLLRDLQSSNGTKVNRKRVTEAALKDGDEICFGPIVCHFRAEKISRKTPDRKTSGEDKSKAVAAAAPAKKVATQLEKNAEPGPPPPFLPRLLLRISESRYFALSLVIHSVIVILAGSLALYTAAMEPPDFVAAGGDGLIATDDLSPPPETPADTVPTEKTVQQAPSVNAPNVAVIATTATTSTFKVALPQVQVRIAPSSANIMRNFGTSRAFAANLTGTLSGRMGAGRARAMAQNGMKPKSEQAVLRGLAWLAEHQNEDGSWGEDNKGAMTGFGVLCFLGHGELQDSPQFGPTVGKALTWIFENGTANEGRLHMAKVFTAQGAYEHAICAYALGEYYTMTKDKRVVKLLTQAIAHIIEGQGPGGSWTYTYDKSRDDLSVSGWQIQALKAAHLGQLPNPEVDKALTKAIAYIERVRGPKGGYGYQNAGDDYSLTGVGILCQLFWKGERGNLRQGMTWLLEQTEKSKPVKYKERSGDLYAWYYHTQACLMFGGEAWTKWNAWFQDEVCDVQNPDGSWPIPGGNSPGPQGADTLTGAVYRTSLCVLMLEVFYRYMPTTRG